MIILETERLLFRDHEACDLEAFCALEGDPVVRRFVGGKPRTYDAASRRFRQGLLKDRGSRLGLWATILKGEGRYVGYCGIYPHFRPGGRPVPREGVLGFTFARAYWNRGLASEAARAFVECGFDELHLQRILASVEAGNAASVHILETLGFRLWRLESVNRRCFYHLEPWNPSRSEKVAEPNARPQRTRAARSALSRRTFGGLSS